MAFYFFCLHYYYILLGVCIHPVTHITCLLRQGDVAQAGLRHSMNIRMTLNPTSTVQGLQMGANVPDCGFLPIIMDFDTMPTLPGACHLFVSVSGQAHE